MMNNFGMNCIHLCHDPLGRYGDEAEDKSLYATRFLEPESLGVKLAPAAA